MSGVNSHNTFVLILIILVYLSIYLDIVLIF